MPANTANAAIRKPRRASAQLSEQIYSLRRAMNLDQPTMAVLIGASVTSISRWEQGYAQMSASATVILKVLLRAVERVGAPLVEQRLRQLVSSDDLTRIVELVHLGDGAGDGKDAAPRLTAVPTTAALAAPASP